MASCPNCQTAYPEEVKICPRDGTILSSGLKKIPSLVGRTIDKKYKVLERVGIGGMGTVYKAEHSMMNRFVALKVLHPTWVQDSEAEEFALRFQREARMASQIEHPNAVMIYDFGIHDEQPYLAMQFVEGENLKSILCESKQLSEQRVIEIMRQICQGVAASHKLGIVHRDLKPDNIMCCPQDDGSERVMVLDFGLAKVVAGSDSKISTSTLTQSGIVMGTPQYISPEQVLGKDLDARSDIYSLGAIMYQMLSGEPPFSGDTGVALLMQHVNDKPKSFKKKIPNLNISPEVEKIVMKALAKDADRRQQSTRAFLTELNACSTDSCWQATLSAETATVEQVAQEQAVQPRSGGMFRQAFAVFGLSFLCLTIGFMLHPMLMVPTAEDAAAQERSEQAQMFVEEGAQELREGHYGYARDAFESALELNPRSSQANYYFGVLHVQLNRFEFAVPALQKAVLLDPEFAEAHFQLGKAYLETGKKNHAVKAFRRTLAIDPENTPAREILKRLKKPKSRIRAARSRR